MENTYPRQAYQFVVDLCSKEKIMDYQRVEINILPAYHGDCIHLRFYSLDNEPKQVDQRESVATPTSPTYKGYNIVIDSGPGKNRAGFKKLMNGIHNSGENVDLLCFTHMDDDHILAAKHYFNTDEELDFIKQIWINIPEGEVMRAQILEASSDELTGAEKTFELYGHILRHGIQCKTEVKQGDKQRFGDLLIRVVLPTQKRLDRYIAEWNKQMENTKLTDAQSEDDSDANGGSVALVVEAMGKKLLFSGDAFAPDLEAVSEDWAGENGFVLVKLPHHGSNANISMSMLKKMKCKNFVISANGSMDRPTQKTVDILGEYGSLCKGVTLYGNYAWDYIDETDGVMIAKLEAEPISIAEGITLRTE